jgi:non-ribosomal peptide synthetase component F
VEAPDRSIDAYSLVTQQSGQVLPDPTTPLDEPDQVLLHQMIKEWVNRTPNKSAIIQNEECWTYLELDKYVSLLARQLISKGLKPGDVVAVCGPRSFNLIASMIAVFLSGGVLLSIDHTLPAQRKELMLREAATKFLICIEARQQEDMVWTDKILPENIIFLNSFPVNSSDVSTASFPDISLNDPAYIFFTSGTTGVPKGVLGTHKGLSHFLSWQRDTFGIQPQDRASQLTALSFDVLLRDVFIALISGGTLCLPPDNIYLDAKQTLRWLQQMHISIVHTVPALAQTW